MRGHCRSFHCIGVAKPPASSAPALSAGLRSSRCRWRGSRTLSFGFATDLGPAPTPCSRPVTRSAPSVSVSGVSAGGLDLFAVSGWRRRRNSRCFVGGLWGGAGSCLARVSLLGRGVCRPGDPAGLLVVPRVLGPSFGGFWVAVADGPARGVLLIFLLVRGACAHRQSHPVALCSTAEPVTHPDGGTVGQKS